MIRAALIGAGQLGSRHLQALAVLGEFGQRPLLPADQIEQAGGGAGHVGAASAGQRLAGGSVVAGRHQQAVGGLDFDPFAHRQGRQVVGPGLDDDALKGRQNPHLGEAPGLGHRLAGGRQRQHQQGIADHRVGQLDHRPGVRRMDQQARRNGEVRRDRGDDDRQGCGAV